MNFVSFGKDWLLPVLSLFGSVASASNCVVNLSHYDHQRPDFDCMRREGIVGIIHEATYPPNTVDEAYSTRQAAALRAGLLWGAYHFANGTDPIRQADFFLNTVAKRWRGASAGSDNPGVLLVLDFEKNGHYPGGTMSVDQAVAFIRRIRERTGKSPGLYASELRIRKILAAPTVTAAQREVFRSCWLWIANYHYVPRATAPWSNWTLWQYTGDGVCDLPAASYPKSICNIRPAERNNFRGSPDAARAFWARHAWQP